MAKVQYPNPKFWKAKDNIDWKKQGENLKEVLGIFGEMLKETDWQKFGQDTVASLKADVDRVKGEYRDFMALDKDEKIDRIVNGERSLGRLYRKGAMATVRREWGHAPHDLLQGPDPRHEQRAVVSLDDLLLLLPRLHGQEHPRPARLQPAHEP